MIRFLSQLKHKFISPKGNYAKDFNKTYPGVLMLQERHLKNCRVLEHRDRILEFLPKKAVCAEIGIETAKTSEKILKAAEPSKLHLIEIDAAWIENARNKFSKELSENRVFLHHGSSYEELSKFDDNYFDWVYIDGDHTYNGAKKDLEVARIKTKDDGLIWLHDYIFYDHISHNKYGVIEAVNEMCHAHDYEMIYYAFHPQMFNSVVLKRIDS